jgi:hypothetical protein
LCHPALGLVRVCGFNVQMAVRLDMDILLEIVGATVVGDAVGLLDSGQIGTIEAVGGGAAAIVHDGSDTWYTWAGISAGSLSIECGCAAEDPCAHGAAVMMLAIQDNFAWSSSATPPPNAEEVAQLRQLLSDLAADAFESDCEPYDLVQAGHDLLDELELFAERPVTAQLLPVVEYAAELWGGLEGRLAESGQKYLDESERINDGFLELHTRLCEQVGVKRTLRLPE